uniref:Uncharacterized protein n=1 Tax=Anguilla anguilla TaxID=7936 RepID=A0A0E9WZP7_ANGAN
MRSAVRPYVCLCHREYCSAVPIVFSILFNTGGVLQKRCENMNNRGRISDTLRERSAGVPSCDRKEIESG